MCLRKFEHLCDYVNDNWSKAAVHLAAYVLWRLNWIHPFADGNGRTARAVSYVVMSTKLDSLLPGTPTIPEQIAGNKRPYYDALEAADLKLTEGMLDVSALEDMLDRMLATQLLSAAKEAKGEVKAPQIGTITEPDYPNFNPVWQHHPQYGFACGFRRRRLFGGELGRRGRRPGEAAIAA